MILPWKASLGVAAVDWHETPGSSRSRSRSRSSQAAMQSFPWVDHLGGFSSSAFALHHAAARLAVHFLRTEDLLRDAGRAAMVSSVVPDEFSPLGNYTPPILLKSPTRGTGNPKYEMRDKSTI